MTDDGPRCDAEYPGTQNLNCLKPADHDGSHATCLGYHPEPYDEWEWAEWEDRARTSETMEANP